MSVLDGLASLGADEFASPLYVALGADLSSYRDGEGDWPVPSADKPGAWKRFPSRATRDTRLDGLDLRWLDGLPRAVGTCIFRVEADEIVAVSADGVLARRARLLYPVTAWDARAARYFAADCVEMVQDELEWPLADDDLPQRTIQAARQQADGMLDAASLREIWVDLHATSRAFTCDIPCIESWLAAWAALDALVEPDPGIAARLAARAAGQAAVAAATWWAGWTAGQDAAWSAQTAAVAETLRRTASERARHEADLTVRAWQAAHLGRYLGLAEPPRPHSLAIGLGHGPAPGPTPAP